ncbi:MAG: type II secretion system protein GspL [Burkholderiaceae bacterium]
MAASFLNRSHALVWLPPRSVGERAFATDACLWVALPVARGSANGKPAYQRCSLESLPKLRAVTLVFDARDVTLLAAQLPALPMARLLKAVPNVVEDSLLADVASCAFAIGPDLPDGLRSVAVIDRSWLEFAVGAFERRGLTVAGAWPAQLALPYRNGGWAVACVNDGIAVRTGDAAGFGWAAADSSQKRAEALAAAMRAASADASARVLSGEGRAATGSDVVPELYADSEDWSSPIERVARMLEQPLHAQALPVPRDCPIDLREALSANARQRWLARVDWRAWRWPAALAAACVLLSLLGLNLHWAQLAQQRTMLKSTIDRRFQQTFPNAQIVDPMLQMQRQVSALRARTGQSGPDDFVPLVARFARALGPRANDSLAGIEYRDGKLSVRFQPVFVESSAVREGLRESCRQQGLVLRFDSDSEPTASVSVSS